MPQSSECAECGKVIGIPDDAAGKKIRCADCGTAYGIQATAGGTLFLVSLAAPRQESESLGDEDALPSSPRSSRRRSAQVPRGGDRRPSRANEGKRRGRKPDSYLAVAIVSMICCGIPGIVCGIMAVSHATKVDSTWARGQIDAANHHSRSARNWIAWGVVAGVIVNTIGAAVYESAMGWDE